MRIKVPSYQQIAFEKKQVKTNDTMFYGFQKQLYFWNSKEMEDVTFHGKMQIDIKEKSDDRLEVAYVL